MAFTLWRIMNRGSAVCLTKDPHVLMKQNFQGRAVPSGPNFPFSDSVNYLPCTLQVKPEYRLGKPVIQCTSVEINLCL
jgi:hypothetical protein